MENSKKILLNSNVEIAEYIINLYKESTNNKLDEINNNSISKIKLQKSLYFLYALWFKYQQILLNGEEAKISKEVISNNSKKNIIELFDITFFAWKYGPVDEEIYENQKNRNFSRKSYKIDLKFNDKLNLNINQIERIKIFINLQLKNIFLIEDFILVNKSHSDISWKNAVDDIGPGSEMDSYLIYKQYNE